MRGNQLHATNCSGYHYLQQGKSLLTTILQLVCNVKQVAWEVEESSISAKSCSETANEASVSDHLTHVLAAKRLAAHA